MRKRVPAKLEINSSSLFNFLLTFSARGFCPASFKASQVKADSGFGCTGTRTHWYVSGMRLMAVLSADSLWASACRT